MPKGEPNKRYTAEFKKPVVETMLVDKLSYPYSFLLYFYSALSYNNHDPVLRQMCDAYIQKNEHAHFRNLCKAQ